MISQEKLQLIGSVSYISKYPIYFFQGISHIDCTYYPDVYQELEVYNPFVCDDHFLETLFFHADDTPQILWENQWIHYGIRKYEDTLCILGPITSASTSKTVTRDYCRTHHIRNDHGFFLTKSSSRKTQMLMTVVHYCLTGNYQPPGNTASLSMTPNTTLPSADYQLMNYKLNNSELGVQHIPYLMEQKLSNAIRHGSLEELRAAASAENAEYSLGTMAMTEHKQQEYQAVVTVSVMSRAAIEGGLNPYDAYDINDLYLQKLSVAKTVQEYQALSMECLVRYCNAVHQVQKQNSHSMHITKCKHFVSTHLNKPFQMEELADYVGLTPKYLGELFHGLEGQTLKSYILQERISAAKNMLKYSNYSLSQIGSYFCFDTPSHFSATFRKYVELTPSEYRKRNKPQNF